MTPTPEHNAPVFHGTDDQLVNALREASSRTTGSYSAVANAAAGLIDTITTWQDISTCPVNVPVRIKVRGWDWYGSNETIAMNVDGVRWHSSAYGFGRDLSPNVVPYAWLPAAPTEGADT